MSCNEKDIWRTGSISSHSGTLHSISISPSNVMPWFTLSSVVFIHSFFHSENLWSTSSERYSVRGSLSFCSCFFFRRILHVTYCVRFRQLALSGRVVWIPNDDCLISLFLIFRNLETPAISLRQLISAVRIHFSSCFSVVQRYAPYRKIGCINFSYTYFLAFFDSFFASPYPSKACEVHSILLHMSFSLLPSVFISIPR